MHDRDAYRVVYRLHPHPFLCRRADILVAYQFLRPVGEGTESRGIEHP